MCAPFHGRGFFVNFCTITKTVFSQIFIEVLSNHIFLESHIVTYYVGAVYVA